MRRRLFFSLILAVASFVSLSVTFVAMVTRDASYSNVGQIEQPNVVMEVLDPSLEVYSAMWQKEVGRRFSNAVVILCHGGDFVEGEWIVGSKPGSGHVEHIDQTIARVKALYPGRTVVILACNTGHLKPKIPGVYFAPSSVWCIPDRAITPEMFRNGIAFRTLNDEDEPASESQSRWDSDPDVVGNIWEFLRS